MMKRILLLTLAIFLLLAGAGWADWWHKSGMGLGPSPSLSGGGLSYLLKDGFDSSVAEGGFSGANLNCVPGTGTRSIIADTGNHLSCGSGNLIFGAKVSATDPTIRFTPASAAKIVSYTITQNNHNATFNPKINATGTNFDLRLAFGSLRFGGASLTYYTGTYADTTIHTLTAMVSGTNAFCFRNGYLIAIFPYAVATINNFDLIIGDTGTFPLNIDSVKMAQLAPIPLALVADNFSGDWPTTSGTGVTTEPGGSGKTWVSDLGTWGSAAGVASCSALDGGTSNGVATIDTGSTDNWYSVEVTRTAGVAGMVINYAGSSDHVRVYHDGTNVKMDLVTTAGGVVNKVSAAKAYSAGKPLTVRVDSGGTYFVFYNYSRVGTDASAGTSITDATVRAATKYGLYTTNTGNSFDNVRCYSTGLNSLVNLLAAGPISGWAMHAWAELPGWGN